MIDARVLGGALRITVTNEGVYVLDLEGRPVFFEHALRSYERGLSGLLVRKSWRGNRRVVEEVSGAERERALGAVYSAVRRALEESGNGDAREALSLAASRGIGWLRADEARFASLYMPVSILPPDQYLSIVLQATIGCAYNRCSFCSFYRDRPYRAREPREFAAHAAQVRDWLGAGALIRRGIFLGDANPLGAPREYVLEYLRIARDVFPGREVHAFSDYFSTRLRPSDYSLLASMGLRRVYIGLESGSRDVLRILSKPPEPRLAVGIARSLGDAGISRGIIVLVGAGGRSMWRAHVEGTMEVLDSMDLSKDDIVFLSRLLVRPDLPYASAVRDHLSEPELDEQEDEMLGALRARGIRVAPYDIREAIY
ncbi:MAG: radical SAM protein [Conexivisphaera sp.]